MCQDREEKLEDVRTKIYGLTNYEATVAANETSNALHDTTWSEYERIFTEECNSDVAYEQIKGVQKSCEQKVCADAEVIIIGINFGSVEVCSTITVSCGIPYDLESDSKWKSYQSEQIDAANEPNTSDIEETDEEEADSEDIMAANQMMASLFYKIDVASNLYIFYCCIMVWFGAPLTMYKSKGFINLLRRCSTINKWLFVLICVVAVEIYYQCDYLAKIDIDTYWSNLSVDPCYSDFDFNVDKTSMIFDHCSTMYTLEQEWQNNMNDMEGTNRTAYAYEICHPTARPTKYTQWAPTETQIGTMNDTGFLGNCNKGDLIEATSSPDETDPGTFVTLLQNIGLVVMLFSKIILTNFGFSTFMFVDPLCKCKGKIETVNPLSQPDPDDIKSFLRARNFPKMIFWGCFACYIIFYLCYFYGIEELGWVLFSLCALGLLALFFLYRRVLKKYRAKREERLNAAGQGTLDKETQDHMETLRKKALNIWVDRVGCKDKLCGCLQMKSAPYKYHTMAISRVKTKYRLKLSLYLCIIGILFSPDVSQYITGFSWSSSEYKLCEAPQGKLDIIREQIYGQTDYYAAIDQNDELYAEKLDFDTYASGIFNKYGSSSGKDWPDGCSAELAAASIAASENRTCPDVTCKTFKNVGLGEWCAPKEKMFRYRSALSRT
eukprot:UN05796